MNRIILIFTVLLVAASLPVQAEQAKQAELVSLRSSDGEPCPEPAFPGAQFIGDRVLPDASMQPFAIPGGSVFIVTDIAFKVSGLTSLPSEPTPVRLGRPCDGPYAGCMESWLDAVVPPDTHELRISLQRGFAIAADTPICVARFDGSEFVFADLYGYVASAPPGQ